MSSATATPHALAIPIESPALFPWLFPAFGVSLCVRSAESNNASGVFGCAL